MKFTFYYSHLCPRCGRAKKHLISILGAAFFHRCVLADVISHPKKSWNDGIRMIPAIRYEQSIISGVMLKREQIQTFLAEHGLLDELENK